MGNYCQFNSLTPEGAMLHLYLGPRGLTVIACAEEEYTSCIIHFGRHEDQFRDGGCGVKQQFPRTDEVDWPCV
jgi:hypothetical protein